MRPTARSLMLMLAGLPVAAVPVLAGNRFWVFWLSYAALVLLLMGVDAVLSRPRRRIEAAVDHPDQLYIGRPGVLEVNLELPGAYRPEQLRVLAEMGHLLDPEPAKSAAVDDRGRASVAFPLAARRRGLAAVGDLWLHWRGPLGLMQCVRRLPRRLEIPVVPDIQSVRSAALNFFGSREFMSGLKLEEFAGDGSEFDRLREFVPGLDHRAMDWKASARHCKLLSREFRAERNHQIVIAIDTGRLMSESLAGQPKLDHAINAGLLLAWYSLRAGDRVGLCGFDKGLNLFRAPQGGVASFPGLHLASAQLDYSSEEANFTLSLAQLGTRLRQRSLIVLMTDFVDTISARLMEDNLQRLARRHLVLFVALRNPLLEATVGQKPAAIRHMARSVVAADILQDREVVLMGLRRHGVHTIDAVPADISPELLNRYLDIKRRELIA
jgi:uncharacterized protein (DUF58 family)